jgi:hypothetical protein
LLAVFSAIEGLMSVAPSRLEIMPLTRAEFCIVREESYEVTDGDSIRIGSKFVSFDRSLKAVVRIVRRIRPDAQRGLAWFLAFVIEVTTAATESAEQLLPDIMAKLEVGHAGT